MKTRLYAFAAAAAVAVGCMAAFGIQRPVAAGEESPALGSLAADVQSLQAQQEKSQREINAKLDRILANQEKILQQLDVVKVRVSLL